MVVRRPWVAGTFYPANPSRLEEVIRGCFTHKLGPGTLPEKKHFKRRIVSVVCPHAGYIYSGLVAAHGFYNLSLEEKPDSIVVIGPNHSGLGGPVSMWGDGAWETPFGKVEIDESLVDVIFKASDFIDINESAHMREHSIEVQLPFLQYIYGELKFVPICMGFQDLDTSREVGRAVSEALAEKNGLILASTDLTHMEPQSSAHRKDRGVIDRIIQLDESALQSWVHSQRVSMCGYGPVSAAIVAAKRLGAENADLLAYQTSGDITGDHNSVVGYAAIKIFK